MVNYECEFQEHGQIVARTDHNVWHYTHPRSLAMRLWGQPTWMRDEVWARECAKTFSTLPEILRIVSASEMAQIWGVSHVTAKKLLRGDWEWIPISARHFVHTYIIASCDPKIRCRRAKLLPAWLSILSTYLHSGKNLLNT